MGIARYFTLTVFILTRIHCTPRSALLFSIVNKFDYFDTRSSSLHLSPLPLSFLFPPPPLFHLCQPLPGKQVARYFDHMSETFLEERQRALDKFLRRLTVHPYFSFSIDLKTFLTATPEVYTHHILYNYRGREGRRVKSIVVQLLEVLLQYIMAKVSTYTLAATFLSPALYPFVQILSA